MDYVVITAISYFKYVMSFAVVEFTENNSVDVVPSKWLPDNISLPVQTLGELNDVEKALDIEENARKMVNISSIALQTYIFFVVDL